MTKREKTLGIAFGALFVVLVGGLGGTAAFQKVADMRTQSTRLAERANDLESVIEARALWEQRNAWIDESVPVYSTSGKAATELISQIDRISNQTGVTIDSKELVNAASEDELDGEEEGGFFESAAIKVRVHGNEEAILTWLHSLQQPTKFTGISSVVLATDDEGLSCDAEVRLWYSAE